MYHDMAAYETKLKDNKQMLLVLFTFVQIILCLNEIIINFSNYKNTRANKGLCHLCILISSLSFVCFFQISLQNELFNITRLLYVVKFTAFFSKFWLCRSISIPIIKNVVFKLTRICKINSSLSLRGIHISHSYLDRFFKEIESIKSKSAYNKRIKSSAVEV